MVDLPSISSSLQRIRVGHGPPVSATPEEPAGRAGGLPGLGLCMRCGKHPRRRDLIQNYGTTSARPVTPPPPPLPPCALTGPLPPPRRRPPAGLVGAHSRRQRPSLPCSRPPLSHGRAPRGGRQLTQRAQPLALRRRSRHWMLAPPSLYGVAESRLMNGSCTGAAATPRVEGRAASLPIATPPASCVQAARARPCSCHPALGTSC